LSVPVTVRGYTNDDFDDVVTILAQASRAAYTFMPWTHSDTSFRWFVCDALKRWDNVRLGVHDKVTVGFACLEGADLDQLFVRPDFQRCSIGRTLLDDIKRLRPDGFMLYTFQANLTARAFYESQGLVATAFGVSEAEKEPDVTYCWKPDVR
jgi:ribosomal protein S18 acetylase RimI-like enzyme